MTRTDYEAMKAQGSAAAVADVERKTTTRAFDREAAWHAKHLPHLPQVFVVAALMMEKADSPHQSFDSLKRNVRARAEARLERLEAAEQS